MIDGHRTFGRGVRGLADDGDVGRLRLQRLGGRRSGGLDRVAGGRPGALGSTGVRRGHVGQGGRAGAPRPGHLLLEPERLLLRLRDRRHPTADRPAGPLPVPQVARPHVLAQADGGQGGRRRRDRQPAHRPLRRARLGGVQPRVRGAVPVRGVPPPDGTALRRPRPVPPRQGGAHPAVRRGRGSAAQVAGAGRWLDLQLRQRGDGDAQEGAHRRPPGLLLRPGGRGTPQSRRDPQHLRALHPCRPRHRDRHARVLVHLPRPAPGPSASDRRGPGADRTGDRGAPPLRDARCRS